jgi:hypothetical protein
MIKSLLPSLAVLTLLTAGVARAEQPAEVVSTGNRFEVKKTLVKEGTTIVLFIQDSSTMEKQFLTDLEAQAPDGEKLGLRAVQLKDLTSPAALQYDIKATPTAIIYDRFGREIARTGVIDEIRAAVRKGMRMDRLVWTEGDDPTTPVPYGVKKEMLESGRMPGIVKAMALRQDAFQMFNIMSQIHFTDGYLKRREHELVGAYVSALNKCKY